MSGFFMTWHPAPMRRTLLMIVMLCWAAQLHAVEAPTASVGSTHFADDAALTFGGTSAAPDCRWEWDTAGAPDSMQLWCTDIDGIRTDGVVCYVDAGTRIWHCLGGVTATLVLAGATATAADFANSAIIGSAGDSGASSTSPIGVVGESVATATAGIGVYGNSATAGASYGYGRYIIGKPGAGADTGNAVGVFAGAILAHAGGANIAGWFRAINGATNYAVYIQDGDIVTVAAADWDLLDNNASALSFDASGKAGILEIVTTNTAEGVNMSGYLTVAGPITVNDGRVMTPDVSTDIAPTQTTLRSGRVYPSTSSTAVTGSSVVIAPANGAIKITGVTRGGTAGDTIAFAWTNTSGTVATVTLTEGVSYTCAAAASDAECVCNLYTAVTGHATLGTVVDTRRTDATCSDEKLFFGTVAQQSIWLVVTPSDGTNTVRVASTDGTVQLHPYLSASVSEVGPRTVVLTKTSGADAAMGLEIGRYDIVSIKGGFGTSHTRGFNTQLTSGAIGLRHYANSTAGVEYVPGGWASIGISTTCGPTPHQMQSTTSSATVRRDAWGLRQAAEGEGP